MITVCIPWRSSPKRELLLHKVKSWYQDRFLDVEFIFADSSPGPFSRSTAINYTMVEASYRKRNIVVINDADTIPDFRALSTALIRCREYGDFVLPYDKYVLMTKDGTDSYLRTGSLSGPVYQGACSGVLVVNTDRFFDIGGFDDRYVGWGGEDVDFAIRAQFHRVPGTVYGLWHEPDERGVLTEANMARLRSEHPGCG